VLVEPTVEIELDEGSQQTLSTASNKWREDLRPTYAPLKGCCQNENFYDKGSVRLPSLVLLIFSSSHLSRSLFRLDSSQCLPPSSSSVLFCRNDAEANGSQPLPWFLNLRFYIPFAILSLTYYLREHASSRVGRLRLVVKKRITGLTA
jgi:hypothetical protein